MSKAVDTYCYTLHAVRKSGRPFNFLVTPHYINQRVCCKVLKICFSQLQYHYEAIADGYDIQKHRAEIEYINMVAQTADNHFIALAHMMGETQTGRVIYVLDIPQITD